MGNGVLPPSAAPPEARAIPRSAVEARILEATKQCCERWGFEKVTIDDIANFAKVSRATLYRLFPGGKDVLFEALRVQELEEFFDRLLAALGSTDDFEELLVRAVVFSMQDMRDDQHLAVMMSTAPGETLDQLTVHGVPRIIRVATTFLTPLVEPYLGRAEAGEVVELLVRLVISGFLAPSDRVDFTNADDVRLFIRKFILPAYTGSLRTPKVTRPAQPARQSSTVTTTPNISIKTSTNISTNTSTEGTP